MKSQNRDLGSEAAVNTETGSFARPFHPVLSYGSMVCASKKDSGEIRLEFPVGVRLMVANENRNVG